MGYCKGGILFLCYQKENYNSLYSQHKKKRDKAVTFSLSQTVQELLYVHTTQQQLLVGEGKQ